MPVAFQDGADKKACRMLDHKAYEDDSFLSCFLVAVDVGLSCMTVPQGNDPYAWDAGDVDDSVEAVEEVHTMFLDTHRGEDEDADDENVDASDYVDEEVVHRMVP
jgi:hypothetical protein